MRNPTVHRDICGTENGYRHHSKRTEEVCQPCKTAWTERCKKYTPSRKTLSFDELAAELEHLLALGQGAHYILKAINYAGREHSLRSRLYAHGRLDLYNRIITEEYMAAA